MGNIINKKINDYEGSSNVGDKTKLCSKKKLTIMKGVLTLVIRPNCVLRKGNVIDYLIEETGDGYIKVRISIDENEMFP